ncbi:hypothetical protein [Paenibacillus sp. GYB003]|uniref:hypothetical protein n=1 Tax=Paenibacillus sp. GYB003 TaxID=2994392 RepID=UPI002F96C801
MNRLLALIEATQTLITQTDHTDDEVIQHYFRGVDDALTLLKQQLKGEPVHGQKAGR